MAPATHGKVTPKNLIKGYPCMQPASRTWNLDLVATEAFNPAANLDGEHANLLLERLRQGARGSVLHLKHSDLSRVGPSVFRVPSSFSLLLCEAHELEILGLAILSRSLGVMSLVCICVYPMPRFAPRPHLALTRAGCRGRFRSSTTNRGGLAPGRGGLRSCKVKTRPQSSVQCSRESSILWRFAEARKRLLSPESVCFVS